LTPYKQAVPSCVTLPYVIALVQVVGHGYGAPPEKMGSLQNRLIDQVPVIPISDL